MNVATSSLHSHLTAYVEAALRRLRYAYRKSGQPRRLQEHAIFSGNACEIGVRSVLDCHAVMSEHRDTLLHLPELAPLLADIPSRAVALGSNAPLAVIGALLSHTGTLDFDRRRFSRFSAPFIQMWQSGCTHVESICILTGVQIRPSTRMLLSEDVRVEPLTDRRKNQLCVHLEHTDIRPADLIGTQAMLVVRARRGLDAFARKNFDALQHAGDQEIDSAITALRLSTQAPLGILSVIRRFSPLPTWTYRGAIIPYRELETRHVRALPFPRTARTRALRLYKSLSAKGAKSLGLAFRRFNMSFSRWSLDDAIIDLAITLEASLARGKSSGFTKELTLRSVSLVGKTIPDVHDQVRLLYDVRGKLVHHGCELKDALRRCDATQSPQQFCVAAQDIVRMVLRRYVELISERNSNIDDVNQDMDRRVLKLLRRAC